MSRRPHDCVIADDSGAIGLGGIIGGESTSVDEGTTDVLLECAWFDPARIGETGRRHGITSDARARFERGIDPMQAAERDRKRGADDHRSRGGEASEPRISGEFPPTAIPIATSRRLSAARLADLGGIDLAPDAGAILGRLEFCAVDPDDPRELAQRSGSDCAELALRRTKLARARADLAARRRRRGRHGRGNRADPATTQIPSTPLDREPRGGPPDRDPGADDRAPGAPHRRRARARRGGHLELHRRGGSRGVRRRRLAPAQSDQRRHEGHAAVAAAGPDRRRAPQPRPRRRVGAAVRDRPPLSCRRRASDPDPAARRRARPARLADGQGARLRRLRRQGRGAGAARGGRRAGRQSAGCPRCRADLAPGPLGDAAARAQDDPRALRRASPAAGPRARCAGRHGRRRNLSRRDPRAARERARAAGLRAAGAAAGAPAISPSSCPAELAAEAISSAPSAAATRRRSPTRACSTGSRPTTACRWRSKSRCSRPTRASPRRRSRAISKRIVAAAENQARALRS